MTTYIIVDGDGNKVTDGVQEHEARRVAQRCADRLQGPVWLSDRDDSDDEGERFDPAPKEVD